MEFIKLFEEYSKGTRSKEITMDQAVDMYLKNCTDWSFDGNQLYRGSNSFDIFYIHGASDEHDPRYSRNMNNVYTSLMANAPSWKNIPRRDKSIIMTDIDWSAESYGNLFVMIPFNGTNIGMCPDNDIWATRIFGEKYDKFSMEDFGYEVGNFLMTNIKDESLVKEREDGSGYYVPGGFTPENIKTMFEQILKTHKQELNLHMVSFMKVTLSTYKKMKSSEKYSFIKHWEKNYPQLNLLDYLYKLLDFDDLGFEIITKQTEMEEEREYWSDGEFIGISKEHYDEFVDKVLDRKTNSR